MQRGNRDLKKFSVAGAQNAGRKWQEMEKHRQWLVLDGLEVIFRSLECISRGKLWLHPDQRRGKQSGGFAVSEEIYWWPGPCSDSGRHLGFGFRVVMPFPVVGDPEEEHIWGERCCLYV